MIGAYLPDEDATRAAFAVLDTARRIADAHGVEVAAVALAWLRARGATAPIASARIPGQLPALLASAALELAADEVTALDEASEPFV